MLIPTESFEVLKHLTPKISISPFGSNTKFSKNEKIADSLFCNPRFWLNGGKDILYLKSGRAALHQALIDIGLTKNDSVLIITTSGGKYISSCVTNTIEMVCEWKHNMNNRTRAILIIHEFGFPCSIPKKIINTGLPIIEDCAYAIGTRIEGGEVGKIGDYAVYSFPKYFPFPFGGILVTRKNKYEKVVSEQLKVTADGKKFLKCQLKAVERNCKEWNDVRKNNWKFFAEGLSQYKIVPFFSSEPTTVPGVFVLKFPDELISKGPKVKEKANAQGIECTEYYTMGGFYFPVHQQLSDYDKNYMLYNLINSIS